MDLTETFFEDGATVEIFGYDTSASVLSRTVPIETGSFQTITFDPAWANLERLEMFNDGSAVLSLDNIAINVVPIPAAVWLFGSALAGLGWLRRKPAV